MKMIIDTEQLIVEVRERPVLWNRKHEFYRNRQYRDAAWSEILNAMAPDYGSMSEAQRTEADKKIQQRWRTARDSYKKEKIYEKTKKRGFENKKRKKYSHSDLLTFLDSDDSTLPDEMEEVEMNLRPESKQGILKISTPVLPAARTPQASFTVNQNKTITEFEVPLLERLRSNESELEIEDLAFFQSLQPSLKRFTRHQKLMFRSQVLNIVMEMENPISIKTEIEN